MASLFHPQSQLRRSQSFSGTASAPSQGLADERSCKASEDQTFYRYCREWQHTRHHSPHYATTQEALTGEQYAELLNTTGPHISRITMALLQLRPVVNTVLSRPVIQLLGQLDQFCREFEDHKQIMELVQSLFAVQSILRVKRSWHLFQYVDNWQWRCAYAFSRACMGDANPLLTLDDILIFVALAELGMEVEVHQIRHPGSVWAGSHKRWLLWLEIWSSMPDELHSLFTEGCKNVNVTMIENVAIIRECVGFGALLFLPQNWAVLLAQINPRHLYMVVRHLQPAIWKRIGLWVLRKVIYNMEPPLAYLQIVADEVMGEQDLDLLLNMPEMWQFVDLEEGGIRL